MFVLPEEVKAVAIGIATIFRDFGYREKRHLARLKFLVADWGAEKFKEKLIEYTEINCKVKEKVHLKDGMQAIFMVFKIKTRWIKICRF